MAHKAQTERIEMRRYMRGAREARMVTSARHKSYRSARTFAAPMRASGLAAPCSYGQRQR